MCSLFKGAVMLCKNVPTGIRMRKGIIQRMEMGLKGLRGFDTNAMSARERVEITQAEAALSTKGSSSIIKSIYVLPPSQVQPDSHRASSDQMESSKGNI